MPLQYVIDAYNIINHTTFPSTRKKQGPVSALLGFIKERKLHGKLKNKVILVFDGYPGTPLQKINEEKIEVIFSGEESADARIKKMLDAAGNPRETVVVSDDREIKFYAKAAGAVSLGAGEFINPEQKKKDTKEDLIKAELNYSQVSQINKELKRLWIDKRND